MTYAGMKTPLSRADVGLETGLHAGLGGTPIGITFKTHLRPHLRRDRRPAVPCPLHPERGRPARRHGPRQKVRGEPGVRRLCRGQPLCFNPLMPKRWLFSIFF